MRITAVETIVLRQPQVAAINDSAQDGLLVVVRTDSGIDGVGENCSTRYEFVDLLDRGGVSIVQPDVTRSGGLTECRRIAALAEERGVPCVPHAWSTGIVKAAAMQLIAAIPNALYLEYCLADSPLNRRLVSGGVRVEAGQAYVPDGPGLGAELDPAVIDEFLVR